MCEFHHELNKELVAAFFTAQYVVRTLQPHEHLKSKTKSALNLTVSLETPSSVISAAVVTYFKER